MTAHMLHWKLAALALATLAAAACAVTGVGVTGGDYDYAGGIYEPYGYDYGGWNRGYRVGPPPGYYRGDGGHEGDHGERGREGEHGDPGRGADRGGRGSGGGAGNSFHAAPQGRSMPSIPGRPRGH